MTRGITDGMVTARTGMAVLIGMPVGGGTTRGMTLGIMAGTAIGGGIVRCILITAHIAVLRER